MAFILFVGFVAFFILWIAKAKGFFVLPSEKLFQRPFISLKSVIIFFAIYLTISLFLGPIFLRIVHVLYAKNHSGPLPISAFNVSQLFVLGSILLLFFVYARADNPALYKRIWKNWNLPSAQPIRIDFGMGFLTWFIAFPLVAFIGEISDILIYQFFGVENYEQVAVRYLKTNISSFETIIVPLFIILLIAPVIEEFLFRGCLQTFLKKYMGVKGAIALSSLFFALFHFAPSQELGNISLLISLFTFALFLGFIFERQSSLFASISLHIAFNTFSTIRILFFPD